MAPVIAPPCDRTSLLSLSRSPSSPNTRPRSRSTNSTALPTATGALLPRYPLRFLSTFVLLPRRPISSGDGKPQRAVQGRQQQIYVYPDPIPEFAEAETRKFQGELLKRLSKDRDTFGSDADAVVRVCGEILNTFLYKEYGGPGTLVIEPFTDMLLALKERKLPGAPAAARAALLWAQSHLDRDWEDWTSRPRK